MAVLVTGGTGYIGSHICVELLDLDEEVVLVDDLSNSSPIVLDRIEEITGKRPIFYKLDVKDEKGLDKIFQENEIEAVIHCAGFKAVGESVSKPIEYYDNNINTSLVLSKVMIKHGVKNLIFSSSATIYGDPLQMPITEDTPKGTCTNPYGWTKWMLEEIFRDIWKTIEGGNLIILRYFNPVGAHKSGLIGESPSGIPNNLTPYITQVAIGKLEKLNVFGNDYDTPDGTGVRDYIHIVDLAKGHVAALNKLREDVGYAVYNLGTGNGNSVLEVLRAFEKAVGMEIPYEIKDRRPGDIATCYCLATKAKEEMGWEAELSLDDMCQDAWNWQKKNPNGFN